VNERFQQFLALSASDRLDVFEATAEELDTVATYIEKDFWVSIVLDILYNGLTTDRPRILFKGGTSLSKVHGLIKRFSEDVDFTIFSADLGFTGDLDHQVVGLSKKKRDKLSDHIKSVSSAHICDRLRIDLETVVKKLSPDCSIAIDESDETRSTLLLKYPSLFENDPYVQPSVKLEGGARSAVDPHQEYMIVPLIASTLPDWDFSVPNVVTIDAQRTFWDKVFILHGTYYGYRYENRIPEDRQRLSRHYYDVAMIYNSEIGKRTVENDELREKVRQHKLDFFKTAWKKFDLAVPGTIRIVPYDNLLTALEQDYRSMQGMMLGTAPNFDDLVEVLKQLENLLN
jgi:predicted nucleotidyltransferase component of viral defense system